MTPFQKSCISHLAGTFVADMEATATVCAPLNAVGALDNIEDPRSMMLAADGALTFVQALRVLRADRSYSGLRLWARGFGIEDIDDQCDWAEQRIREAGGARFIDVA
jgi:hypothetical protein